MCQLPVIESINRYVPPFDTPLSGPVSEDMAADSTGGRGRRGLRGLGARGTALTRVNIVAGLTSHCLPWLWP